VTAGGVGPTAGGVGAGVGGEVQVAPGLHGALRRYQVMAFVVGIGLLVLVLVGVPLQYAANQPKVVQIVGPIHGFLYIVYLLAATDLARRARFSLLQMAAMIGAGFLPFLAFVIERRVSRRVRTEVLPSWSSLWRSRPAEPGSSLGN
jgi:integral membrane protein